MTRSCNLSVTLAILCIGVCSTSAFFFGRQERIATSNGREIDESCLAKADEGNCEFYTCFELRLPCGRDWYILKQGLYYCNKIERVIETFPEDVQTFLREANTCLMQSLKNAYREDMISCHDLEHQAVDAISSCYLDNAFCTRVQGNYAQFFGIYEVNDLFSTGAGKVWREILSLAQECGSEAVQSLTGDARETISDAVENMVDNLRSRFDDLFKKK